MKNLKKSSLKIEYHISNFHPTYNKLMKERIIK